MSAAQTPLTEEDIALAAELAMRLLSPADEALARARITRDAAFAAFGGVSASSCLGEGAGSDRASRVSR
jgi:hypothetical protein